MEIESIKTRDLYFDFLRGIAIIGVIAIHCFNDNVNNSNFELLIRNALNCSVPIFLAISGYFLSKKTFNDFSSYWAFVKKQIVRVWLPMSICSIPYLLLGLRHTEDAGGVFVNLLLLVSGGFSIYYFIPLIIQFYLLLPIFKKINTIRRIAIVLVVNILAMVVLFYVQNILHLKLPLLLYAAPFPVWIAFFSLGCFFGQGGTLKLSPMVNSIFIISCLLFAFVETRYITTMVGSISGVGIKSSASLYSFFALIFLFNRWGAFSNHLGVVRLITFIGNLSFGIYLTHMYVLLIIDRFINVNWGGRLLICLLVTTGVCYMIKRLSPRFSNIVLGL